MAKRRAGQWQWQWRKTNHWLCFPYILQTHVDEFLCILTQKQPDNPPVPFRLSRHLSVCLLSRFSVLHTFPQWRHTKSAAINSDSGNGSSSFTGSVTTSDSLQSEWLAYYTGQWQLIINCHPNAAITKINIGCYRHLQRLHWMVETVEFWSQFKATVQNS